MAASDDNPMQLYEVFQNCFNNIANKQKDKHGQPVTTYGDGQEVYPATPGAPPSTAPSVGNPYGPSSPYFPFGGAAGSAPGPAGKRPALPSVGSLKKRDEGEMDSNGKPSAGVGQQQWYVGDDYNMDSAGRYGSYFLEGGAPGGDPWNTQYSSYSPGGMMGAAPQASPHYGMTSIAEGMVCGGGGDLASGLPSMTSFRAPPASTPAAVSPHMSAGSPMYSGAPLPPPPAQPPAQPPNTGDTLGKALASIYSPEQPGGSYSGGTVPTTPTTRMPDEHLDDAIGLLRDQAQGGKIEERLDDALTVMRSHAEPPSALPLHPGAALPPPPPPPHSAHGNGLLYNMEQHVAGLRAAAGSAPPYGQLVSPPEAAERTAGGAKKRKEAPDSTELAANLSSSSVAASTTSAAAAAAAAAASSKAKRPRRYPGQRSDVDCCSEEEPDLDPSTKLLREKERRSANNQRERPDTLAIFCYSPTSALDPTARGSLAEDPRQRHKRGVQRARSHGDRAHGQRQGADQAGDSSSCRRGHQPAGGAGPRAEPEPEGGLPEAPGGGEGGGHAAPPAPRRHRRHPLQHEPHQRQPRGCGALPLFTAPTVATPIGSRRQPSFWSRPRAALRSVAAPRRVPCDTY